MYVVREDLTSAYQEALEKVVERNYVFALMIEVRKPLSGNDIIDGELGLRCVNIDRDLHEKFKAFVFSDGKSGAWWIEDRLREMSEGLYRRAVINHNQLGFVRLALESRKRYSWVSNRLLCFTFDPYDKRLSHVHLTRQPMPPCLAFVDLKPEKNVLHLIASWRAQFFDTKAYGNLLSLAVLLRELCEECGYEPGRLYSLANKAILKNRRDARRLLEWMRSQGSGVQPRPSRIPRREDEKCRCT